MPRVRHLTGGALFPCRLFLVAGHLSCDASSIGWNTGNFSGISYGRPLWWKNQNPPAFRQAGFAQICRVQTQLRVPTQHRLQNRWKRPQNSVSAESPL